MYEEQQNLDMHASNGVFAITINDGTGARTDTSRMSIDRIFANYGALTFGAGICAVGTTYNPNSADSRKLQVYFKDETMATWEPMPAQNINFVPFAFEAKQVAGFTASSLVRVAEADGPLDTGNTGYAGTGRITLPGVNQTIDASAVSEGKMPGLAISSSGTATFIGTITIYNGGYTFNSGSLNAGTSTLKFSGNAASYSAKFGGKTYYNVLVNPWGGSGLSVAALDSIIVSNSLTLSGYLGLDMPNPGGAYSVNVTGTLNVGAGSTLSLHGASKTQGTLVNSGTINP